MAKVFTKIAALTLFVPKALAVNKSFLVASEYRRQTRMPLAPRAIRVVPTDCSHWLAEVSLWGKDEQNRSVKIPQLPAAPIPADVKQACLRRWRQGALGLRV